MCPRFAGVSSGTTRATWTQTSCSSSHARSFAVHFQREPPTKTRASCTHLGTPYQTHLTCTTAQHEDWTSITDVLFADRTHPSLVATKMFAKRLRLLSVTRSFTFPLSSRPSFLPHSASLCLFSCVSVSLALTHSHSLSLSLSLSHSVTLSLFHSFTLSHSLTLSLSHSHTVVEGINVTVV